MVYISSQGAADRYRINQALPSALTISFDDGLPSYTVGDTSTSISSPTVASNNDPGGASTTQSGDAFPSSDTPTATLIRVTALPPATTSLPPVLPKLPYHSQLNVFYLIPLFVALGVVLGAITAVICLKWRENRRRSLRTSTLLSGPPYAPPKSGDQDRLLPHGYPSLEQVSLFAAGTPSKFTIHGSRYIPKRTSTWQSLEATQLPYIQTIIPSSDGERFSVVAEEDPFIATSPMVSQQSSKEASDTFLPSIRILPPLADRSSGDKCDSLKAELPKPFRRSMFDILKLKSYRPAASVRKENAVVTRDDEPSSTNLPHRIASFKALAGDRSIVSARHSLDDGPRVGDTEDMLELLGLQDEKYDPTDAAGVLPRQTTLLKEAALSSPTRSEKTRKQRKVTPFVSESKRSSRDRYDESIDLRRDDEIEEEDRSDIYTRAPRRRRSQASQRKLSADDTWRRSSIPDTHASVLPLSPPSLMSPPLEKTLFFTSPLSSSLSLASRNTFVPVHSSPLRHVDGSPELNLFPLPTNKTRATKKLKTSRPEPPLPYPPYSERHHAQTTPRKRSTTVLSKRQSVSPGSPKPKGRSTSATHRESTSGICSLGSLSPTSLATALVSSSSSDMLSKVDDIVALGYTMKRAFTGGAVEDAAGSLHESV